MTSPTCKVVRSGDAYVGRQGFTYLTGLTGSSIGSRGISMTVVTSMYFGGALEDVVTARAGDYVYVPPDVPL